MDVHLVCQDWGSDWVIARLVQHLVRFNGWTVDRAPRMGADVNVYFPYLDWRHERFTGSRLAAWFTHRETQRAEKVAMWDEAAKVMDLRVTPAKMYVPVLKGSGPTAHIPHPVELDKFVPAKRKRGAHPAVGVSGFVYQGGRKGERLISRLVNEHGPRWELRASGKGWPIPTTLYEWDRLHEFYQHLDVFLCTSLCEGGPVTVLEALACGIPVVVPSGVGQMDELPEMVGIWHYKAGDYASMVVALEKAVASQPDPVALRALVERHTPERWATDWLLALEGLFRPTVSETLPDWRGQAGMYCVAQGSSARKCVKRLIETFKKHMPGIPVAMASETPLGLEDVLVQCPDTEIGGRKWKTLIYDLAPREWHYVMYLDADIEVKGDISFLFDLLRDGWDMCICTNPGRYVHTRQMVRKDNREECEVTFKELGTDELIQLQGGVFALRRNERTERFFKAWNAEWDRWGKRDQGALLRAMHKSEVRLYLLGIEWNTSVRYEAPNGTAGLVHHQMEARRHEGIIWGRNDSEEAWEKVRQWEASKA